MDSTMDQNLVDDDNAIKAKIDAAKQALRAADETLEQAKFLEYVSHEISVICATYNNMLSDFRDDMNLKMQRLEELKAQHEETAMGQNNEWYPFDPMP